VRSSLTLGSSVSCRYRPGSWCARFLKQASVRPDVTVFCGRLGLVWRRAILLPPQLGHSGLARARRSSLQLSWRLTPISERLNSNFFGVCTEKTLKMSHPSLPCSENNKGDTFPTLSLLVLWGLATFNRSYQFDPDNKLRKWRCSVPFWLILIQPLCLLGNAPGKFLCLSSLDTPHRVCWRILREGRRSIPQYGFISAWLAEGSGKRQAGSQGISANLEISLFHTNFWPSSQRYRSR